MEIAQNAVVMPDLGVVIADVIRNPVHQTAWMPNQARHDNNISTFTFHFLYFKKFI